MYSSLSDFYTSEEWRKFRKIVIAERTNKEDGFLYDEYSGRPIVRAYDVILHHKIPLTLQNVNDVRISLNPENVMVVSQRSHNEIHARFGHGSERKVYLVYGPPFAGKSTWVREVKGNSDLVVDVDEIWKALTGGEKYDKPDALKAVVFRLRDELLGMVERRVGKWERAYIIDGAPAVADRERKLKIFGAEPVFINTERDVCMKRLYDTCKRDESVREAWARYIERWFAEHTESA